MKTRRFIYGLMLVLAISLLAGCCGWPGWWWDDGYYGGHHDNGLHRGERR